MSIANIKSGIEARLAISIPSYSKAAYEIDIADNKFKGNAALFSVVPGSASEVDGLINAFTLDHTFTITLSNSYNQGAKSQIGDTLKSSRITELNDDILAAYKDLCVNKSAISSTILVLNQLEVNEAEFIDESKVILISFTVNIKHKTNT